MPPPKPQEGDGATNEAGKTLFCSKIVRKSNNSAKVEPFDSNAPIMQTSPLPVSQDLFSINLYAAGG